MKGTGLARARALIIQFHKASRRASRGLLLARRAGERKVELSEYVRRRTSIPAESTHFARPLAACCSCGFTNLPVTPLSMLMGVVCRGTIFQKDSMHSRCTEKYTARRLHRRRTVDNAIDPIQAVHLFYYIGVYVCVGNVYICTHVSP